MGRPQINIDWEHVGKMLEADCTATGIAANLGCDRDTLYTRCKKDLKMDFTAFAQQRKAKGDDLLKMKQFQTAMSGNVVMQIWLGKQRLGQRDKSDQDVTIIDNDIIRQQAQVIRTLAAKAGKTPADLFRETLETAQRSGVAIKPEIQSGVLKALLDGADSKAVN